MAKQPSQKILKRIARALMARYETHSPVTGAQVRGPVWPGRLLPRRPVLSTGYTPEYRDHNLEIEARGLGFGVMPDSPLAHALASLQRPQRRLLLAAVQAAPGPRRARLQRRFQREVGR